MLTGGCRCGAIRYQCDAAPTRHGLCHCRDCQRSSGAPAVAWIALPSESFAIVEGKPRLWNGAGAAQRAFCERCGTPLYYLNEEMLPGIVDVHTTTLDEPEIGPPQKQVQCAERLSWMARLGDIPEFERFGG